MSRGQTGGKKQKSACCKQAIKLLYEANMHILADYGGYIYFILYKKRQGHKKDIKLPSAHAHVR